MLPRINRLVSDLVYCCVIVWSYHSYRWTYCMTAVCIPGYYYYLNLNLTAIACEKRFWNYRQSPENWSTFFKKWLISFIFCRCTFFSFAFLLLLLFSDRLFLFTLLVVDKTDLCVHCIFSYWFLKRVLI